MYFHLLGLSGADEAVIGPRWCCPIGDTGFPEAEKLMCGGGGREPLPTGPGRPPGPGGCGRDPLASAAHLPVSGAGGE